MKFISIVIEVDSKFLIEESSDSEDVSIISNTSALVSYQITSTGLGWSAEPKNLGQACLTQLFRCEYPKKKTSQAQTDEHTGKKRLGNRT